MKRILILAALLAGCAKTSNDNSAYDPAVYMDRATGCQYLAPGLDSRASLTPRTAADGKTHKGCREVRRSSDSTVART